MSKFCSTVDTSLIWKPCKILKFILELETIQSAYATVITITTLYTNVNLLEICRRKKL
jgi:hypothetical protein